MYIIFYHWRFRLGSNIFYMNPCTENRPALSIFAVVLVQLVGLCAILCLTALFEDQQTLHTTALPHEPVKMCVYLCVGT